MTSYDWQSVDSSLPKPEEVVLVFQLYPGWAEHNGITWIALDDCGNRRPLEWRPEFWRRAYFPADPIKQDQTNSDKGEQG